MNDNVIQASFLRFCIGWLAAYFIRVNLTALSPLFSLKIIKERLLCFLPWIIWDMKSLVWLPDKLRLYPKQFIRSWCSTWRPYFQCSMSTICFIPINSSGMGHAKILIHQIEVVSRRLNNGGWDCFSRKPVDQSKEAYVSRVLFGHCVSIRVR